MVDEWKAKQEEKNGLIWEKKDQKMSNMAEGWMIGSG